MVDDFKENPGAIKREFFKLRFTIGKGGTYTNDEGQKVVYAPSIKIGDWKVTAHELAALRACLNEDEEVISELRKRLADERAAMQDVKY